jgi:hypothetical protein
MKTKSIKNVFRILLGTPMFFAGIGHLTFLRVEFKTQINRWLPV